MVGRSQDTPKARRKRLELPDVLALSIALIDDTPGLADEAYESLRSIRPQEAERMLGELEAVRMDAKISEALGFLLAQQSFAA